VSSTKNTKKEIRADVTVQDILIYEKVMTQWDPKQKGVWVRMHYYREKENFFRVMGELSLGLRKLDERGNYED